MSVPSAAWVGVLGDCGDEVPMLPQPARTRALRSAMPLIFMCFSVDERTRTVYQRMNFACVRQERVQALVPDFWQMGWFEKCLQIPIL